MYTLGEKNNTKDVRCRISFFFKVGVGEEVRLWARPLNWEISISVEQYG